MPVQAKRGLARSVDDIRSTSREGENEHDLRELTWRDDTVSNDQYASESSFFGYSSHGCPFYLRGNLLLDPAGKSVFEDHATGS